MKKLLLIIIAVYLTVTGTAQTTMTDTTGRYVEIHLLDYYKEKGVIFNKDYVVGIEMSNMQYRYTPSITDIKIAEETFNGKYNQLQEEDGDSKRKFSKYIRQYIGFIDSNGSKNIVVQLINNSKPKKLRRMFAKDWETVFIVQLSDSFYALSRRFRINIDTLEISTKL